MWIKHQNSITDITGKRLRLDSEGVYYMVGDNNGGLIVRRFCTKYPTMLFNNIWEALQAGAKTFESTEKELEREVVLDDESEKDK